MTSKNLDNISSQPNFGAFLNLKTNNMKTNVAVLHLKSKDPQDVYNLADRVNTNLETNKLIFTNPNPTLAVFTAAIILLGANIRAKDGSKLKNVAIADQTDVVYNMLKLLLVYVNGVAAGDETMILLSGFDCNNEAVNHGVPARAVVNRIEDGSVPCSAKIFMSTLDNADRYKVEISTTPNDPESWKTVIDFGGVSRLEIRDLVYGQKIYIRVSAGNTHGWGTPSEPVAFLPR